MHEMRLAKIYQYTKFYISSFTHSNFTEGSLKFENWPLDLDPDDAPFGGNLSLVRWDYSRDLYVHQI